ncbi:MAG: outer membrane protein assembly factor BamB family protein [Ktedonobacterales bacterium]
MRGNGKVFVSHTHIDNERCEPLLAALDAWGVDYWFDREQLGPGQHLSERIQTAIAERTMLLRICTGATLESFWMTQEMSAFRGMQLEEQQHRQRTDRLSINLILDPAYKTGAHYVAGVSERADVTIDATGKPQVAWMNELRTALGVAVESKSTSKMSRRAALGLGAAGVITAAALGTGGVLLASRGKTAQAIIPKPTVVPFATEKPLDARVKWYFKVSGRAAVALANSTLFVVASDGLYALNPADGAIHWVKPRIGGNENTTMEIVGTTMYVTSVSGTIYALDAAHGAEIWHKSLGSFLSDSFFAYANGVLYAYPDDGSIYALKASDGSQIWKSANLGETSLSDHVPAAVGGLVFVGSPDGNLYALKASDGSIAWQHQTGGEIRGKPTVANGIVYFGSNDKSVYALHTGDGSVAWKYRSEFEVEFAPAVAGGVAYIGLKDSLYALDALNGKVLWSAPAGDSVDSAGYVRDGALASSGAAVAGDQIYENFGGYLYAFSASQKKYVWRFQTSQFGNNVTLPVVDQGVVYWAGENSTVYALSAQ